MWFARAPPICRRVASRARRKSSKMTATIVFSTGTARSPMNGDFASAASGEASGCGRHGSASITGMCCGTPRSPGSASSCCRRSSSARRSGAAISKQCCATLNSTIPRSTPSGPGTSLFHRTTRRLSLTETGQAYYERARRILADIIEAEEVARRLQSELKGTLKVAAPMIGAMFSTAGLLRRNLAISNQ
jgi:hypothetical protein